MCEPIVKELKLTCADYLRHPTESTECRTVKNSVSIPFGRSSPIALLDGIWVASPISAGLEESGEPR